jgi:D-alanyl-lipoteichoic acid acyltransferase DltB (MBOAT superfamily)
MLLATWLYAFQIFFDFSGYTDMALGAGRLFNIRLTQNFNGPYLATSIADFWRRWHISFSRWILDYLFKPLQMRLRDWKNQGTAVALLVTFIASGVWHGASWGFIIWGGMHGVFLASSVYYKPWQKKLHASLKVEKSQFLKWWQIFVTFNLVCLSWIFFRAESVSDAWYVLTHLVDGLPLDLHAVTSKQWIQHNILLDQSWREAAVVCLTLMLCVVISIVKRKSTSDVLEFLRTKTLTARWALYYALLCALILFAVYEKGSFIYYQF